VARLSVQVQDSYGFDPGNTNIQDYVGPFGFNMTFIQLFDGWLDKSEISLAAQPGGSLPMGGSRRLSIVMVLSLRRIKNRSRFLPAVLQRFC